MTKILHIDGGGYFDMKMPVSVINDCSQYSTTTVRRGMTIADTKLGFKDGVLVSMDADYPGSATAAASMPGAVVGGVLSGAGELLTLRIENRDTETSLLNAETEYLKAQSVLEAARRGEFVEQDAAVSESE